MNLISVTAAIGLTLNGKVQLKHEAVIENGVCWNYIVWLKPLRKMTDDKKGPSLVLGFGEPKPKDFLLEDWGQQCEYSVYYVMR